MGSQFNSPSTLPAPALQITRQKEPECLEFPFSTLNSFITSNDQFYVRSHFPVPEIEPDSWSLKLEGEVEQSVELSYEDILRLPSESQIVTLECAGNGRVFLRPNVSGVQWELGAVSTAEWRGVPLSSLLYSAGVRPGAVDVVLEGADKGTVSTNQRPAGVISFSRSMPLDRAMAGDVLLAYEMNGETLPASHGFPIRAVVPGWYAMASVKWLKRIVVTNRPFAGYFQTIDYSYWDNMDGTPVLQPLSELKVKSEIARPMLHEQVPMNRVYRVYGAAWTSDGLVTAVDVSSDDGKEWRPARLLDTPVQNAWRLWEFDWHTPGRPGTCTVMSRATDSRGQVQPTEHNQNRGSYMINHMIPVEVEVG